MAFEEAMEDVARTGPRGVAPEIPLYMGTSLIRNRTPPRTATGPYAYAYCRVLGGGVFL